MKITRRELSAMMLTAPILAASMMVAAPMAVLAQNTPRPVMPLVITMPDGTTLPISKYAGKVIVLEFLMTTCPHCQHTAEQMTRLQAQYGPKGFQPIGVAFNDGEMLRVPAFVRDHKVSFPVGVVAREKALQFLGYSEMTRVNVPQTAFIDRQGRIRYQSTPTVDEALHEEVKMKAIIEELLKESPSTSKPATSASAKKK